jgi:uncharacterized membrane protein YheB (UPF0754 family)
VTPSFEWVFLLIPAISAVVGWGTNVLAVKMMFYPVDFVGLRPLGWQGIVPANARALAAKSTRLITQKLINLRIALASFDPESFAGANLDQALEELTDQVIAETVGKHAPGAWKEMAEPARAQIRRLIRTDLGKVAVDILRDVSDSIEEIIDLEEIVVDTAERDRRLIGEMFQQVGSQEFEFIRRSGAYFGFLFGVVQLGAWVIYPAWWVLPAFGFLVGYTTNLLAIKLIFEPAEPRRFGPLVIQGLFHKRQEAVSRQFARMVSGDILNPDNIVAHMISGRHGERLYGIVEHHVGSMLDRYRESPLTAAALPEVDWDQVRAEVFARLKTELPAPDGFLYVFVSRAVDIYGNLLEKMTQLDSHSFEGILRPPFQRDEWKLVVAGAALGCIAGILQILFLFGDRAL